MSSKTKPRFRCDNCGETFAAKGEKRTHKKPGRCQAKFDKPDTKPDWGGKCIVCGQSPIVPETDMCGPCTFGEATTAGGNW